ncbi:MAG: hypothetical protein ACK5WV_09020, partial [Chryseotalea sp.]
FHTLYTSPIKKACNIVLKGTFYTDIPRSNRNGTSLKQKKCLALKARQCISSRLKHVIRDKKTEVYLCFFKEHLSFTKALGKK